MNNQSPYKSTYVLKGESNERRNVEITRRLKMLQYRRERLTKELGAINSALVLLSKQVSQESFYTQKTLLN